MTWYWWTHWFWITSLSGTISCFPSGSVDTSSSSNPYSHGKIYNKGEPLKFPIAVQSDSVDIFDGRELLEAKFHEDWISSNIKLKDLEKNDQDFDDVERNKSTANTESPLIDAIPMGKEVNENTSTVNEAMNVTLSNSTSSTVNATLIPNPSAQSNVTVIQATDLNVTNRIASPKVEKITKLKNISIKPQYARPDPQFGGPLNGSAATPIERHEVVREEIEKEVISDRGRQSKILAEYSETLKIVNFTEATKNLLARSAISISSDDVGDDDEETLNSEALIIKRATILDAGAISGICLAVIGLSFAVSAAGVMLYRRRYINKPQTLSEPDSSGYIDDSTIRDNSDEMYSLDNDSFLNSLEAMTIQNYWTDNVKHTKL